MAIITYKSIINNAIKGFNDIQKTLSNFTDLGVSGLTNTSGTVSGSLTPAQLVTYIGRLATIKKSNTTNTVTEKDGFITGRIAYRTNPSFSTAPVLNSTYSATVNGTNYKIKNLTDIKNNPGYYDGTIEFQLPAATASISITNTSLSTTIGKENTGNGNDIFSEVSLEDSAPSSGYFVKVKNSANSKQLNVAPTVTKAGYIDSNKATNIAPPSSISIDVSADEKFICIPAANPDHSITVAQSFTPELEKMTTDSTSKESINITAVVGNATTTEPSTGYFIAARSKTQTAKTVSAIATTVINTGEAERDGYLDGNYKSTVRTTVGLNNSNTTYFSVNAATFNASSDAIFEVTENTTKINGANNISSKASVSLNIPSVDSGVYFYAIDMSSSGNATVKDAGYAPSGANTGIVTGSDTAFVTIEEAESYNGYVVEDGYITEEKQHYTVEYDTTNKCVDFIFNN